MDGSAGGADGWRPDPYGNQGPPGTAAGSGHRLAIIAGTVVIVVLAVAIVAVLIADGGTTDNREVNLQTALLTLQDLDGDFEFVRLGEPDQVDYRGGPECDALIERMDQVEGSPAQVDASTGFRGEPEVYIRHVLSWVNEDTNAIGDLEAAVADCSQYQQVYPDSTMTVIQQRLPSDDLGEASIAYAQNWHTVRNDGVEEAYVGFRIAWERDGVLSTVMYLDASTEVEPGNLLVAGDVERLVSELAATADRRLEQVLQG